MESLPHDVWHKILQIGIETTRLDHTDLCSFGVVNSHFDQLTQDPAFWTILLHRDFPYSFHLIGSPKTAYRKQHEQKKRLELEFQCALDAHKYPYSLQTLSDWMGVPRQKKRRELEFRCALDGQIYPYSCQILSDWLPPPRHEIRCIGLTSSATTHGSSTESNISHDLTEIRFIANCFETIDIKDTPPLDEEGDDYPAIQPTLRQVNKEHYKFKQFKRFDKSAKPKVVPNSKSYIPMNRRPHRSMPRKT